MWGGPWRQRRLSILHFERQKKKNKEKKNTKSNNNLVWIACFLMANAFNVFCFKKNKLSVNLHLTWVNSDPCRRGRKKGHFL